MHKTDQQHPTLQQLAAFGLGKLEDEQVRRIEEHLNECDECALVAKDLPDDSLIDLLRNSTDPTQGPTVLFDPAEANVPTIIPPSEQATLMPGRSDTDLSTNLSNAKRIDELDVPPALVGHDRYAIQSRLGKGGMGSVFKAQHRIMNRPVALKVINPQLLSHPGAIKRFHREIQAASRLSHANIVTAYDADHAGDSHFFVMEFVDGVDLDQVVKQRGPLPTNEACDFIRQAALGLQHAHEQGMIHRDIKPHNLMLAASGDVKILDFGLANFASETAAEEVEETHPGQQAPAAEVLHQLTQMGTMMGTPDYIAPEQAKDAHAADIRADIYSLGGTLYALLTGQTPFGEGSVLDKIQAHANRDVPPLSDFRDDVTAEVEAILKKMMAKDPRERYQTPQEVAEALKPLCQATPEPSKTRRFPRAWSAVACLLAAVIGFAVYYIQTNHGVVRVEVADDSLLVKLGGQTITMKDGEKELTIRPGEQTLIVEREDGFQFETEKFQLRRGDVIALKVELLPGEVIVQKDGERFGAKALLGTRESIAARSSLQKSLNSLAEALRADSDDNQLAAWTKAHSPVLLSPNDLATRAVLKLLGGLSKKDQEQLLKDGYLKWPFNQLDPSWQAEFKEAVRLRMFPQPAATLMNAETMDSIVTNILKNEVGFYVTEIPESHEAMIGWFPATTPIPLFGSAGGLDEKHGAKLLQFQRNRAEEVQKLPNSPLPKRVLADDDPLAKRLDALAADVSDGLDDAELAYWIENESPVLAPQEPPFPRTALELLGGLSAMDRNRLLKDGYLKWEFEKLDASRRAAFEKLYRLILFRDSENAVHQDLREDQIEAALDNKNVTVGFAIIPLPQSEDAMISWCILPRVGFAKPFGLPLLGLTPAVVRRGPVMDIQLARLRVLQSKPNSPLPKKLGDEVVVTYTDEGDQGTIYLDELEVTPGELRHLLKERLQENPNLQVRLEGDIELNDPKANQLISWIVLAGVNVKNVKLSQENATQIAEFASRARNQAVRKQQLKQIGLALHAYHEAHKTFPSAFDGRGFSEGVPHLSWRVRLLPYIEQEVLYKKFHLDEPWNSKHNLALLAEMPALFKTTDDPTRTTFLAVEGEGTAFDGLKGLTFDDFQDGVTNTAYVVDAGEGNAVPWTKPEDLPFIEEDPIRAFGTSDFGNEFLALMADASVKAIPYDTAPEQLRNLFLRADGNVLDLSEKRRSPLPSPNANKITLVREFKGHTNMVKSVAFSPDGDWIASASGFPLGDNTVRIWNRERGADVYVLTDHNIPVVFVIYSPDGKRLLSGDQNGRFILWNLESERELTSWRKKTTTWRNEGIMIADAVFTPDGKQVVYLKVDPSAADAAMKNATQAPRNEEELEALKKLKEQIPSLIKRTIEVVDASNGKSVKSISLNDNAQSGLAVTPDGLHVLVPMYDGTVRLISLETEKEIRSYAAPKVEASRPNGKPGMELPDLRTVAYVAAVSPDGNKIAAGYQNHAVRIWDLKTGKVLKDIRTANQATIRLAFFSDNRRLAACGQVVEAHPDDPAACVLDTETGEVLAATPAFLGDGFAFALAPDETQFLTAGGGYFDGNSLNWKGTGDYHLHLWQLPESVLPRPDGSGLKPAGKLPGDGNTVEAMAYLPDGKHLITGNKGKQLVVWDVATGKRLNTLPWNQPVRRILVLPDGRVVAGGDAGGVRIWNLDDPAKSVDLPDQGAIVGGLEVSPDGKTLLIACTEVSLWDLATMKKLRSVPANCRGAAFINQGKQIVHLDHSQAIVRDTETLKIDRVVAEVSSRRNLLELAVSADGKCVAFGDVEIFIHELSTGGEIARISISPTTLLRGLAFLPDNRTLVAGDDTPQIRLIDAAGLLNTAAGHNWRARLLTSFSAACQPGSHRAGNGHPQKTNGSAAGVFQNESRQSRRVLENRRQTGRCQS